MDFRSARLTAGLSQTLLAARAGVHRSAIVALEAGRGRLDTAMAVAATLDQRLGLLKISDATNIGTALLARRVARGLSRRFVAAMAGLAVATVTAIEAGKLSVHLAAVQSLGVALGSSLVLRSNTRPVYWRSEDHSWGTPPALAAALAEAVGGFDLDAASPGPTVSSIPARHHLTAEDDALTADWHGRTYMNPPYGRTLDRWVKKARSETDAGRAEIVVGLVPVRADTRWWHDHVAGIADVFALRGRLRFGGATENAPFPSAVVIWWHGKPNEGIRDRLTAALPDAWHIPVTASRPSGAVTGTQSPE